MFCKKCGYKNKDLDEFCQKCGSQLKENTNPEKTISFKPITDKQKEVEVGINEVPEEGALLIVKKGSTAGQKFLLNKDKITIGRHLGSDIFLDDITVSRKHAEINFDSEGAILRDMGSLNGTYINNELVEEVRLKNTNEIQIGRFKLVFLTKPR
ncbi:FHA domain-containing protein [Candidatus Oleimmundimicrobium sp.]|uniref:FHA domain-containing protein n=1 Tax=Candidatus Oleimmundimicrobium sp. TaxID=3060597 RepID=UPI002721B2AA|nr:FHA domain-containing protein [Candidatus Oleimmundimicrobium sp.]MDO8885325.1 FHA domain-containing protein [Candidatus Oleimmundimicrobium sp.]